MIKREACQGAGRWAQTRVEEMPTAEGWSTSKSFGMGRKIVCYGSIASFRIQEQNKHSACQLSEVFSAVLSGRIARQ